MQYVEQNENLNKNEEEFPAASEVTQLIKDLQAKHAAEKEVLKNDITVYKRLIRQVIAKYKTLLKQK